MFVGNGIDNHPALDQALKGKRLGLITNGSAVDRTLKSTLDILHEKYHLTKLFNTIYGVRTEFVYGERVLHYTDIPTGLPVESIFHRECNGPTEEMLQDLDAVVFDMKEAGCRYYEYLYCLANAMRACAKAKMPFIVLDRIAPINGVDVEGVVCPSEMHTMVGDYGLPNRIGLTIGEFAQYINNEFMIGCDLKVVPNVGWRRSQYYDETGLPWILPSPNLPHTTANLLYAGMCLFEGISNINEGRGTSKPFELIGAPWLNAAELAKRMNEKKLDGVAFGNIFYIPVSSKHAKEICHGLQIHVLDRKTFQPVRMALTLIEEIRKLHPDTLEWAGATAGHDVKQPDSPVQFDYYFDKLLGTSDFREGVYTADQLLELHRPKVEQYRTSKCKYHLYEE